MQALELEYDPHRPVMEAIQAGDAHAMAEFMRTQGRWVRAVAYGVLGRTGDLDDVCQRVWIQVWRQARRLDDPARWRSWVYRIVRNAATDAARAGQRRKRLGGLSGTDADVLAATPAPVHTSPERSVLADEEHRAILEAIGRLPEIYREPFVLKHVEGWSYAEIGELLGLPPDTVETRLVRARRLLREKLAGKV